jgi:hypothetical protein
MTRRSAADYAQRKVVRIIPENGVAHLVNNAVNLLAIEGGATSIIMTGIVLCKIRDLMLHVMMTGDNEIVFAEIEKKDTCHDNIRHSL